MKLTNLFAGLFALLLLCATASADLIKDPDMSMDAGSFSIPLSQFTSFTPNQTTGGGILDLFNDTGHLLTSFSLTTYINTGLPEGLIESDFACSTGSNPFFLNCGITYDPTTGALTMSFFGVKPDRYGLVFAGEQEGIPAGWPWCNATNEDKWYCAYQGHFAISFNDDFSFTGDTGGWAASDTVDFDGTTYALFNGPPSFQVTTPEPAAILLFGTVLIAIATAAWKGRSARPPFGSERTANR